jgi:pimeloyl-ACP methyl ester carboxylesterase
MVSDTFLAPGGFWAFTGQMAIEVLPSASGSLPVGQLREWVKHVGAGGAAIACQIIEPVVGVALLVHGRDGAGTSAHMVPIADAYAGRGWRVVAPDLPFSRATPGSGPPEDFTMQRHVEAARQVLHWVLGEMPVAHRLALAGHSMGAYAIARLAAESVAADHLLAVSPVVSGTALLEARRAMGPAAIEAFEREAPRLRAEMTADDAVPALQRITVPVAVVTGREDGITPVAAARAYFTAAPAAAFYSALPGEHHCPQGPLYTTALAAALDALGA